MHVPVLERMSDEAVVALLVGGEEWPRSFFNVTPIPDTWMALVERPGGGRWFVPAGEEPKCERDDRLLLVRNRAIVVPVTLPETRTTDDHFVEGECELLLRWEARDDDLAALAKLIGAEGRLTLARLAALACENGALAALRDFVRAKPAAETVHQDQAATLADVVKTAMRRWLFSVGAVLERVASARFSSATLAQQEARAREAAERVERIKTREMVEHAALAATQRRLADLSGIFSKLKAAAGGEEQMRWHELLPALSPLERGRLLENLWRITPDRLTAQAIVIVAGDAVLWLDPAAPETVQRRATLPEDLGGLRSVAFDAVRKWLLVGAARGVWAVHAETGDVLDRYEAPDAGTPRTGFNAVAVAGDAVYATHSQLGCWRWPLGDAAQADCLLKLENGIPRTVRAITPAADGTLLFAADSAVYRYSPEQHSVQTLGEVGDVVHALATIEDQVFAGAAGGGLYRASLREPRTWQLVQRFREPLESVHARRWQDLIELVVPAGAEGICGVYADENLVARLMEAPTPVRRAWACDDLIVGLTTARDKLIVLNANLPERQTHAVPLARLMGHSIQDACLIVGAAAGELSGASPAPADEAAA